MTFIQHIISGPVRNAVMCSSLLTCKERAPLPQSAIHLNPIVLPPWTDFHLPQLLQFCYVVLSLGSHDLQPELLTQLCWFPYFYCHHPQVFTLQPASVIFLRLNLTTSLAI